jgi:excisionase family DNA binding protein
MPTASLIPASSPQMNDTQTSSDLFTNREAAAFLRTSIPSLWRMRKQRKISFFRVGNKCLFKRSDLEAFLERQRLNVEAAA